VPVIVTTVVIVMAVARMPPAVVVMSVKVAVPVAMMVVVVVVVPMTPGDAEQNTDGKNQLQHGGLLADITLPTGISLPSYEAAAVK
jgi:hypothetical protein